MLSINNENDMIKSVISKNTGFPNWAAIDSSPSFSRFYFAKATSQSKLIVLSLNKNKLFFILPLGQGNLKSTSDDNWDDASDEDTTSKAKSKKKSSKFDDESSSDNGEADKGTEEISNPKKPPLKEPAKDVASKKLVETTKDATSRQVAEPAKNIAPKKVAEPAEAKQEAPQPARPTKTVKDDRPMLSGAVKLTQFPLGSGDDCKNLATQLSTMVLDKFYNEDINRNDLFVLLNTLLPGIMDELDLVDCQQISSKVDSILKKKQQGMKRGKKMSSLFLNKLCAIIEQNTKPQLGKKFQGKDAKKTVDSTEKKKQPTGNERNEGDYDSDDFELFD
ncbi:hypothetical protein RFI_24715 [Reticulomyxa filosa]|uniref:Uncharacterized protein n=1 Tax=Reticulomyxa filosa TaxID=46433 RepID=X6MG50_RETFI|nr:hypothetical protein RFI_24715 [Reticulomyxa filosa]|eukprot:ETO12661.1 hypothetical protein RFI_24715 [Reticulomyxa filosa]